ncbi:SDR family oxidoreductase [Pseudomonas sp. 273]|uniref:SDR family oxidoreductase n=1 Tax=Pseudomonas sp. 273 TaxID=75692 RepID=UPI0023D89DAD|nr:SDR family oxidoreductase [Pseudomonas sp. 273]
MQPPPEFASDSYRAAGKLEGKVALTFAREGADVMLLYLEETEDATKTCQLIEACGQHCLVLAGDVADGAFCAEVARRLKELRGRSGCR